MSCQGPCCCRRGRESMAADRLIMGFARIALLVCVCLAAASSSEMCRTRRYHYEYCIDGCCKGNYYYACCRNDEKDDDDDDDDDDDNDKEKDSGIVVGAVLAGIASIFVIVAIIGTFCCCCAAASKTRGRSSRVVHPLPAITRYDVFYTGASGDLPPYNRPLVPGAQPLQPPPYKREPDPSPPSYTAVGVVRPPEHAQTIAGSSSAPEGDPSLRNLPAPHSEELPRIFSPPPPYSEEPVLPNTPNSSGAAPRSTAFPR